MCKPILSYERLRELLDYDPETGVFTRRIQLSPRYPIGSAAGSDDGTGYLQTTIDGSKHRLHRLAARQAAKLIYHPSAPVAQQGA